MSALKLRQNKKKNKKQGQRPSRRKAGTGTGGQGSHPPWVFAHNSLRSLHSSLQTRDVSVGWGCTRALGKDEAEDNGTGWGWRAGVAEIDKIPPERSQPTSGKLGRGGQKVWDTYSRPAHRPSTSSRAKGAARALHTYPSLAHGTLPAPGRAHSPAPGAAGGAVPPGRCEGRGLCARAASSGYKLNRGLLGHTPPKGQVPLRHLLWTSGHTSPPNGPQLLLLHW